MYEALTSVEGNGDPACLVVFDAGFFFFFIVLLLYLSHCLILMGNSFKLGTRSVIKSKAGEKVMVHSRTMAFKRPPIRPVSPCLAGCHVMHRHREHQLECPRFPQFGPIRVHESSGCPGIRWHQPVDAFGFPSRTKAEVERSPVCRSIADRHGTCAGGIGLTVSPVVGTFEVIHGPISAFGSWQRAS
jgi:hypothetical protein